MLFDATVAGRTMRVDVRGQDGRFVVSLDGRTFDVDVQDTGRDFVSLIIEGRSYEVGLERKASGYMTVLSDDTFHVELADVARGFVVARKPDDGPARIMAPMPGKLLRVLVQAGQDVATGQGLVVMEAMKMENELRSPRAGRVTEIAVREGQAVETGALLAVVE